MHPFSAPTRQRTTRGSPVAAGVDRSRVVYRGCKTSSERFNSRIAEQVEHAELGRAALAQPSVYLEKLERVAAEIEEVGVAVEVCDTQDLRPDAGDHSLSVGDWRLGCRTGHGRSTVWSRQGVSVDFAVGRQRQDIQDDHRRWQHVLGQGYRERGSEVGGIDR